MVDKTRSMSLEELIALNDEIRALTRAGIPLGSGLRALSQDIPGKLGRLTDQLGQHLESGEGLERAIARPEFGFPPIYQAVLTAGVRSGRLTAALEGIATTAHRVNEVRRTTVVGLIYPFLIYTVAVLVFTLTITETTGTVAFVYDELSIQRPAWYVWQASLTSSLAAALPWIWIATSVALVVWYFWSLRASRLQDSAGWRWSSLARLMRVGKLAAFSELLALLVEREIPIADGLRLAGNAVGDAHLCSAASDLSNQIERGSRLDQLPPNFPPLLGWLLCSPTNSVLLARNLRESASSYRRRAEYLSTWLTVVQPVVLSVGIGGLLTLAYVVTVLAPFYYLMFQLSLP